jgi:hypothetical protein
VVCAATSGTACQWSVGNVWVCEVDGLSGEFEFKGLKNDATWETGPKRRGTAGATLDLQPQGF